MVADKTVALILLNWNGREDTFRCLESVYESEYPLNAVIVVDNGSRESPDKIKEAYPQIILIKNEENMGYAGGNNIGIKAALELNTDYIWILNNDTSVEASCLKLLVRKFEGDSNIGAVTNRIGYLDNKKNCWYAGGYFKKGMPGHYGGSQLMDHVPVPKKIDYLSGCSFLIRASVIEKVGMFDENFFAYCEDLDLSIRITNEGYMLAYEPEAIVWHKAQGATECCSETMLYYMHRNIIYVHRKHKISCFLTFFCILKSLRNALWYLIRDQQPQKTRAIIRGLKDGLLGRVGREI